MTTRGPMGAGARSGGDAADDALARLVRLIARQAAQEAFAVFRDAFEASFAQAKLPVDAPARPAAEAEMAANALTPSKPDERFLGVAEVAKRLDVSEKTVRRWIASGELASHRLSKLIRVGERDLFACLAAGRLRQPKVR